MKINFIYGEYPCGGKDFDFTNIEGAFLTGSETTCFMYAKYLAQLGHDVSLITRLSTDEMTWENVKILSINNFQNNLNADCFISYNDPDPLKYVNPSAVRVMVQQINDFSYCSPNFNDYVDIFISPSPSHAEYLQSMYPQTSGKWQSVPNCTTANLHNPNAEKDPGKIIWASSPDRGLHLVLQEWKKIRKAAPFANLHIFYNIDHWVDMTRNVQRTDHILRREWKNRAEYIERKLKEMKKGYGIHLHKGVPKKQIYKEMDSATVLAFPCATIAYTESFSCTTLESMASGTIPVISKQDSLGQIYGSVCPAIDVPASQHMEEFSDKVIEILLNENVKNELKQKCVEFSKNFYFDDWSKKFENIILSHKK